jgi:hypothetical protein
MEVDLTRRLDECTFKQQNTSSRLSGVTSSANAMHSSQDESTCPTDLKTSTTLPTCKNEITQILFVIEEVGNDSGHGDLAEP